MNNQIGTKEKMAIIEDLKDREKVLDILTSHEIAQAGHIKSIDAYARGEDRKGVIVNVEGKSGEGTMKIMIDVKWGQPSTDQVYDAIYEMGKDCSRRVIAFTGGVSENDKNNPAAHELLVSSLIANMNAFPLGLSLMKIDDQLNTDLVDLENVETAEFANTYSMRDLPSKERFREAEFWLVQYDSLNSAFYEEWKAFSSGIRKTSRYGEWSDINGLEVHVGWNHEGAFFSVKVGDYDNDYVTAVWNLKECEIKERYPGRRVELLNLPGKLPRIYIGFWDLPVSWLVTAATEEKVARAEMLHAELNELREMMEYALDEVKKSQKEESSSTASVESHSLEVHMG